MTSKKSESGAPHSAFNLLLFFYYQHVFLNLEIPKVNVCPVFDATVRKEMGPPGNQPRRKFPMEGYPAPLPQLLQ